MVMPAVHHAYITYGFCNEQFREHYWRRADGGLGLIIVGSCRFDGYGAGMNSLSLDSEDKIPGLKVFTDGMHERGCPVAAQLFHAGRYISKKDIPSGGDALAPSAEFTSFTGEIPQSMTEGQIRSLISDYASAAMRAKKAGFDAVEICGCSGYLLCQFLSPLTNRREDEYGGNFENRCRFPLEVIESIRNAVGPDFPLIYKLSGSDLVPGSNTIDDILEFVPKAEAKGIDCFSVTGGWHESTVPQLTGDVPRAGFSHFSRKVKEACSVPVIMCNRVNTPAAGELSLALGDADLIGLARASIADPDFANKVKNGEQDEIRPCVACNQGCLANAFFGRPVRCLSNGLCGHEHELKKPKDADRKKILVVGGGPAGCEAAIRLAQLGHHVTLWEKRKKLGGQLNLAAVVPGRQEFKLLMDYYYTMLLKLGVEVYYEKTGSVETICGFEKVIWAAGGVSSHSKLKLSSKTVPVVTAWQVLTGKEFPGSNVVIIGGSFVACEVARYLSREASVDADRLYYMMVNHLHHRDEIENMLHSCKREIVILEKGSKIGLGYEPGTAWTVMRDLKRLGVRTVPNTYVKNVDGSGVTALVNHGSISEEEIRFSCDTVVLVPGIKPDSLTVEELRLAGIDAVAIGNAKAIGRAIDAIRSAAELSM